VLPGDAGLPVSRGSELKGPSNTVLLGGHFRVIIPLVLVLRSKWWKAKQQESCWRPTRWTGECSDVWYW
jgi:hypothetical protein